jgi:TolB protein
MVVRLYGLVLLVALVVIFIFRGDNDRWIVFESDRNGSKDVYIVGVDGTGLRQLTTYEGQDGHPSWSPDGRWIVFESYRNRNWDIYRVHPLGTQLAPIRRTIGIERFPRWEGSSIVYKGQVATQFTDVRMSLDGQPLDVPIASGEAWAVSPDGEWVIATYLEQTRSHLYRIHATSEERELLTQHGGNDSAPSWSHDGEWLVFSSDVGGNWDVYTMRPDGSERRRITTHPDRDLRPSLSPHFDRAFHLLALLSLSAILMSAHRLLGLIR